MSKFKSQKGFTLAELLVVVAIIAVLVAISIPVFTAQLKKARLAVDEANIREAYSLMQYAMITEDITVDGVTKSLSDIANSANLSDYYFYLAKDGSLTHDSTKAYRLQASEDTCEQLENGLISLPNDNFTYSVGHTKDYRIAIQAYVINSNVELVLIAK